MKNFKLLVTSVLMIGLLICSFSLFAQDGYSISQISLSPKSPASLNHYQKVTISFNYTIPTAEGVHLRAQLMSGGSPSPGQEFEPSGLITARAGSISRFSTITTGTVIVNQIRIQIHNKAKTNRLYQKFVDVSYSFHKPSGGITRCVLSVHNIKFSPNSPASINLKQYVNISFDYSSCSKDV